LATILHIVGLEPGRYHAWRRAEKACALTVDRLVDRATILRFTGKSFRDPKEIVGAPLDE
jgi:hypothetical protein